MAHSNLLGLISHEMMQFYMLYTFAHNANHWLLPYLKILDSQYTYYLFIIIFLFILHSDSSV